MAFDSSLKDTYVFDEIDIVDVTFDSSLKDTEWLRDLWEKKYRSFDSSLKDTLLTVFLSTPLGQLSIPH